jgi:hypothetical protein
MPIQTAADSISNSQGSPFGFKNRIINGAMVLDQRNAGALINPAVSGYTVDRWYYYQSQTSKGTIGQNAGSVTPPVGFTNYLGFTSTSAYSINSTDQFFIQQPIEGFNFADLGFGSANAKTVTLSFQVYSSLTGTFGGALQNSAATRNYPFTYTISTANTWTQISVTIAGDTTGTWVGATNGTGIKVVFSLGSGTSQSATAGAWTGTSFITSATGATSVVGTNGATFYITGVQLEKGTQATAFDYRDFGNELRLCQRYFEKTYDLTTAPGTNTGSSRWWFNGTNDNGGNGYFPIYFKVIKRADPTITFYQVGGTAGSWNYHSAATGATTGTAGVSVSGTGNMTCYTLASGGAFLGMFTSGHWTASSEL